MKDYGVKQNVMIRESSAVLEKNCFSSKCSYQSFNCFHVMDRFCILGEVEFELWPLGFSVCVYISLFLAQVYSSVLITWF